MSRLWMLFCILFLAQKVSCAKYRDKQRHAVEHAEVQNSGYPGLNVSRENRNTPLLSNPSIGGTNNKQSTDELQDRDVKKPRSQSKANLIENKAKRLFKSGLGLSMEECTKHATAEITEKRRIYSQRQRQRNKELGIKRKRITKKVPDTKERIVGRMIVKILEGKNGIIKHDIARSMAEKHYSQQTNARSAKYRRNKRLAKAKAKNSQGEKVDK